MSCSSCICVMCAVNSTTRLLRLTTFLGGGFVLFVQGYVTVFLEVHCLVVRNATKVARLNCALWWIWWFI